MTSASAPETATDRNPQARLDATAQQAAERAKVTVRTLQTTEMQAAAELLGAVWTAPQTPIETSLLVALGHAGNYCAGAFAAEARLVGVAVGFFAEPLGEVLHSHVTGVAAEAIGAGVGTAIKQHQRAWCARRGLSTIAWTYDPLVAGNAWFNLGRLGARPAKYLLDFYGVLADGRNAGQGSDRLLVHWPVVPVGTEAHPTDGPRTSALVVGAGEEPVGVEPDSDAAVCTVAVPTDIEAVRAHDPELGLRWRWAFRDTYLRLTEDGWQVRGFAREGHYEMERA